jgi:hypothetical protein
MDGGKCATRYFPQDRRASQPVVSVTSASSPGDILVGHLKSGHTWSLQNRPTGLAEDLMILPSLGRFERRHLLADDFAYVPCYLW